MELAAILFCLFFAMNIGASGAAASMGVAYGSGAVKKKTRQTVRAPKNSR